MRLIFLLLYITITTSCTDTKFSAESPKHPTPSTNQKTTTNKPSNSEAIENPSANDPSTSTNPSMDPNTNSVPPIVPDDVVDGMEVVNNCGRCLERAKQLSPQAGFTADFSRTHNLGFYKIAPSKGLCDIHFMASMSTPISDHEGRDSVLNNQVALYCPCNCNWARTYD